MVSFKFYDQFYNILKDMHEAISRIESPCEYSSYRIVPVDIPFCCRLTISIKQEVHVLELHELECITGSSIHFSADFFYRVERFIPESFESGESDFESTWAYFDVCSLRGYEKDDRDPLL